jgi:hypothetical protein
MTIPKPPTPQPDLDLRPGNESARQVLVAARVRGRRSPGTPKWEPAPRLPGLYWIREGAAAGDGHVFGPGFNARASDFPEGTRLIVTAQIEMPAEPARFDGEDYPEWTEKHYPSGVAT